MRMKIRRRMALCAGLLATPLMAGAPAGFASGQWQHQTRLLEAQVPGYPQWLIKLVASHSSRMSCNGATELGRHPETLFQADGKAICTLRRLSMADGRLAFDTFCTNKRFPQGLLVSSSGSYSPTSYSLSTTSSGTQDGKPVHIVTAETGQHVADHCSPS